MQAKPLRMLIVEDDEDFQVVLRKEFKRLGARVPVETCFLESVADAQKVIERTSVDVIVSDFELPDGTGADLMEHAQHQAPGSRRIVLTNAPERAREETRRRSPPHAVWDKSIGLTELRQRLFNLVSAHAPLPTR